MQYIKELSQYHSDRDSAVTFGKFDGLHRGHQKLVRKVQELSTNENVNSIVCAFDMHPLWKEKGITPQLIMDQRERYLPGICQNACGRFYRTDYQQASSRQICCGGNRFPVWI